MTTIKLDHALETNLPPGSFVGRNPRPQQTYPTTQRSNTHYQTQQTNKRPAYLINTRFPATQQTTRSPVTQIAVSADSHCGLRVFTKPATTALFFNGKSVIRGEFPW